jgi:hypothetical protein
MTISQKVSLNLLAASSKNAQTRHDPYFHNYEGIQGFPKQAITMCLRIAGGLCANWCGETHHRRRAVDATLKGKLTA